jgi:galactonate dehydratase
VKVTRAELFAVPPRWLFLRLEADDGTVGWGEPIVEGRAATVATAVQELLEHVVGSDPRRIEDTFQVLYRGGFYRGGPILTSAISGIEQALWDIKARALGVPIHELLGGRVRDRVRVYAWIGGDRPEQASAAALRRLEEGYRAVKMNATAEAGYTEPPAFVRAVVDRAEAVRAAIGPGADLALDFHGRVHTALAARVLDALRGVHPMFVEEPVLPEHLDALPELARRTSIPLATGERLYTRWGFRELLQRGGLAIAQPDVSHAGGIWETRKIAAMAEAYDVALAPHCPLGPIALAAALQVDACTPNASIQEQSFGIHYNDGGDVDSYVRRAGWLRPSEGSIAVPDGPGLGIEVDEPVVREAAARAARDGVATWRNPIWRLADASVAEW